jgi:hypothetical protein
MVEAKLTKHQPDDSRIWMLADRDAPTVLRARSIYVVSTQFLDQMKLNCQRLGLLSLHASYLRILESSLYALKLPTL